MARRQLTKQFKEDAYDHSNLSVNDCAYNLGISTHTLHGWVKKAKKTGEVHLLKLNSFRAFSVSELNQKYSD